MLNFLLELIFPSLCLHCKTRTKNGDPVCTECAESIRLNRTLFCGKCGLRLAGGKRVCHKDFPYLLGSATEYDGRMKNIIHGFKFRYMKKAAEPLGRLLIRYAEQTAPSLIGYTVIPIPLSGTRLRERGFNQSELIAKIFADCFLLPVATNALIRIKNIKPQSETESVSERRENVRACFAVKNPGLVRGESIVLIDDVTTSGATLLEAAIALKTAGAKKILALTVARA